ncbi:hypothetical protein [Plantactinospora sp. KBS50]|uniref:hypothetical protein n=1 Tax=Plantactinospora sp. KBS50 TaxID=2024580 RepID=UPI000BAAF82C|nr:hypothetical protein [Plantactinospora sp. KBS50]ASW57677.1 hypothetical protein CIK06_13795 [Plantactinospora sp. KBS50]
MDLLGQLAALSARVAAQRAEAQTWYAGQREAADRAVTSAEETVLRAQARVAACRERADRVDTEVRTLWQVLPARLSLPAGRLGAPPTPEPGGPEDPAVPLDAARTLIDRAARPVELPTSVNPLLVIFGVLGAVLAAGLGALARVAGERYGGDLRVGLPVVGLLVTLLGPVVGLVPARRLADRRHAVLGPRPIIVVVVAGLLTTGTLVTLLR